VHATTWGAGGGLYRAVAEALCDGDLAHLEKLSLISHSEVGNDSVMILSQALEARAASGHPVRFQDNLRGFALKRNR
jgi:hypothetical protein